MRFQGMIPPKTKWQIKNMQSIEFSAKYPYISYLNIYISKKSIKKLLKIIDEPFENEIILKDYIDMIKEMQFNDKELKEFIITYNDDTQRKLYIINCNLHSNKGDNELLYGIILHKQQQKSYENKQQVWSGELTQYLTEKEITGKYGLESHLTSLPQSWHQYDSFINELYKKHKPIHDSMIDDTDWINIKQIHCKINNIPKITITFTKEMWIKQCKQSFKNDKYPLIPVIVIDDKLNIHWIEWIKIMIIEPYNLYIGISCKEKEQGWIIKSICLDPNDILCRYRLIGYNLPCFDDQLDVFKIGIFEIRFENNNDTQHGNDTKQYGDV